MSHAPIFSLVVSSVDGKTRTIAGVVEMIFNFFHAARVDVIEIDPREGTLIDDPMECALMNYGIGLIYGLALASNMTFHEFIRAGLAAKADQ